MPVNKIIEELEHRAQEIAQDIEKELKDLTADAVKAAAEPRHGFGTAFGREY